MKLGQLIAYTRDRRAAVQVGDIARYSEVAARFKAARRSRVSPAPEGYPVLVLMDLSHPGAEQGRFVFKGASAAGQSVDSDPASTTPIPPPEPKTAPKKETTPGRRQPKSKVEPEEQASVEELLPPAAEE